MARFLPLVALAILTTACGDRKQAKQLLEQIQDEEYRNTYARAPGWEQPFAASQGPHGKFVDIYVNDTLLEAIESGESLDAWPDGSLIVKDGWEDADGDGLRYVALMEKRGGGKWFWAEYNDKLRVKFAGEDIRVCAGCHASGEDQVRAFDLP